MKDYLDLFNAHDEAVSREWDKIVSGRPICACCGEAIMDDICIRVEDDFFCNEGDCKKVAMEVIFDLCKSEYMTRVSA